MPADIDKSDTYLQLERLKVLFSICQENMIRYLKTTINNCTNYEKI